MMSIKMTYHQAYIDFRPSKFSPEYDCIGGAIGVKI